MGIADTSVSTRSSSQAPFVFIPFIKRGFFIFQLGHTNAEMKQFFPNGDLFLSAALKPEDGWNQRYYRRTVYPPYAEAGASDHREAHKGFDTKKPIKNIFTENAINRHLYDDRNRHHKQKDASECYFSDRISIETTR